MFKTRSELHKITHRLRSRKVTFAPLRLNTSPHTSPRVETCRLSVLCSNLPLQLSTSNKHRPVISDRYWHRGGRVNDDDAKVAWVTTPVVPVRGKKQAYCKGFRSRLVRCSFPRSTPRHQHRQNPLALILTATILATPTDYGLGGSSSPGDGEACLPMGGEVVLIASVESELAMLLYSPPVIS